MSGGNLTGRRACGAKTKRGGSCQAPPMANGRCRVHGGATPRGKDSPHWRHGGYSRYLPDRLAEGVDEALRDPELQALRWDIAVEHTLIGEALAGLRDGVPPVEGWREIRAAAVDLRRMIAAGDVEGLLPRLGELLALVEEGASDAESRAEVFALMDSRRRLIESEAKRERDLDQYITRAAAFALIGAVLGVIRTYVRDPDLLAALSRGIGNLIAGDVAGGVVPRFE